jgi:serine-type D-Ala-D-Ala carboxypeptidase (penicillin-binding protein 5/6)
VTLSRFQWNLKTGLFTAFLMVFAVTPVMAIETTASSAIIIEMATGETLLEKDADQLMPPASMSKLMTLYMLFDRLKSGALSLEDKFRISDNAWRKGGAKSGSSTMFLNPRKRVKVEELIRGIIVQSGNDACIVVAEALSGSEAAFAAEMTEKARELGMENSQFMNATGWPDPDHRMTPRDLATLARRLIEDFPEYYHYFSELEFTYNGIRQMNRNPLLYKEMNADGLKTGHTQESGYGLTASTLRRDRRLILVVNGLPSKKARSAEPERLLEWAYREFKTYALFKAGDTVEEAEIWLGTATRVPLVITQDLRMTLPRKDRRKLDVRVKYIGPVPAPIKKGQEIAKLVIKTPFKGTQEFPLVAGADVERLGLIGRLMAALQTILWGEAG